MGIEAIIAVFPRRRMRHDRRPGRRLTHILFGVMTAALMMPAIYWSVSTSRILSARTDLAARGVPAEVLESFGDCYGSKNRMSGRVTPTGCELTISYRVRPEHGGQIHLARVHLSGAQPSLFASPAVYDAANPDLAMLQSELEKGPPYVSIGIAAMFWLLALAMISFWRFDMKPGLRAAARAPKPVAVPVLRYLRQRPSNVLHVYFECPDGKTASDAFLSEAPFLLPVPAGKDPSRQWALAIQGQRGRPYLLDRDLRFLDFTDEERASILAAATV